MKNLKLMKKFAKLRMIHQIIENSKIMKKYLRMIDQINEDSKNNKVINEK